MGLPCWGTRQNAGGLLDLHREASRDSARADCSLSLTEAAHLSCGDGILELMHPHVEPAESVDLVLILLSHLHIGWRWPRHGGLCSCMNHEMVT